MSIKSGIMVKQGKNEKLYLKKSSLASVNFNSNYGTIRKNNLMYECYSFVK